MFSSRKYSSTEIICYFILQKCKVSFKRALEGWDSNTAGKDSLSRGFFCCRWTDILLEPQDTRRSHKNVTLCFARVEKISQVPQKVVSQTSFSCLKTQDLSANGGCAQTDRPVYHRTEPDSAVIQRPQLSVNRNLTPLLTNITSPGDIILSSAHQHTFQGGKHNFQKGTGGHCVSSRLSSEAGGPQTFRKLQLFFVWSQLREQKLYKHRPWREYDYEIMRTSYITSYISWFWIYCPSGSWTFHSPKPFCICETPAVYPIVHSHSPRPESWLLIQLFIAVHCYASRMTSHKCDC